MRNAALAWRPRQGREWASPERHPRHEWLADKPRSIYPGGDLQQAIEDSRSMLALPPNWDDSGSPEIRKETWERATEFLSKVAGFLWAVSGATFPAPSIVPGTEGSIDLHWKTPRRELLINIPEDAKASAHYYGDDYAADKRKGVIDPGNLNVGLFAWLALTD